MWVRFPLGVPKGEEMEEEVEEEVEFYCNGKELLEKIIENSNTNEEIADDVNNFINNFAISIIDKCIELAQEKKEIRSSKELLGSTKCPLCNAVYLGVFPKGEDGACCHRSLNFLKAE